jgi:prepilin-type N-terminal cleavage/methylation domain-containing protein
MKWHNKRWEGFMLIELLIVIAIIGILSTVVMVSLNDTRAKAREALRVSQMQQVTTALHLYQSDYGHYPCVDDWDRSTEPSGSPTFIPELVTKGYLPTQIKDPLQDADDSFHYEYRSFSPPGSSGCGEYVYLGTYNEVNTPNCTGYGKVSGTKHCHIFLPSVPSCAGDEDWETTGECENIWQD